MIKKNKIRKPALGAPRKAGQRPDQHTHSWLVTVTVAAPRRTAAPQARLLDEVRNTIEALINAELSCFGLAKAKATVGDRLLDLAEVQGDLAVNNAPTLWPSAAQRTAGTAKPKSLLI